MSRTITLAGQDYELRYDLERRSIIERAQKKSLWTLITDGFLDSQVAIIWAGIVDIKRRGNGRLDFDCNERDVLEMLEKQRVEGEYDPIMRACAWAIFEARLLGREVDPTTMRTFFGEDPEGPKAETSGTVTAAS